MPLSFIVLIYNFLKRKFTLTKKFKIPIICVGNIYVGGTGKTPTSILIAQELYKRRKNPVILKKFYENQFDEQNLIKIIMIILFVRAIEPKELKKLKNMNSTQ